MNVVPFVILLVTSSCAQTDKAPKSQQATYRDISAEVGKPSTFDFLRKDGAKFRCLPGLDCNVATVAGLQKLRPNEESVSGRGKLALTCLGTTGKCFLRIWD